MKTGRWLSEREETGHRCLQAHGDSGRQPPGRAEVTRVLPVLSKAVSILQSTMVKGLPIGTALNYQPVTIFPDGWYGCLSVGKAEASTGKIS